MRVMLDVAGVNVAVLIIPPDEIISGLAGFVEPTRLHFRDEPCAKTKTHPHCAEWVRRTLSYPHVGAQLQQQQRRAGQTRMGIGYAAGKTPSNVVPAFQSRTAGEASAPHTQKIMILQCGRWNPMLH